MKRFFDWLVRGLDQAGQRAAILRENENMQREHEAEKRGLRESYERQASALQAQIKNLKATMAELEQKLCSRPALLSPAEVANRMRAEAFVFHDSEGESKSVLISHVLVEQIQQASTATGLSFRQILSGMVRYTWPDKQL